MSNGSILHKKYVRNDSWMVEVRKKIFSKTIYFAGWEWKITSVDNLLIKRFIFSLTYSWSILDTKKKSY